MIQPGTGPLLTQNSDVEFEGQHFDRKEVGQVGSDAAKFSKQFQGIIEEITQTVSAFANKNVEGGLLVLGIAKDGRITGTSHLTEKQCNSISDFGSLLHHQAAEAKFHDCSDAAGKPE